MALGAGDQRRLVARDQTSCGQQLSRPAAGQFADRPDPVGHFVGGEPVLGVAVQLRTVRTGAPQAHHLGVQPCRGTGRGAAGHSGDPGLQHVPVRAQDGLDLFGGHPAVAPADGAAPAAEDPQPELRVVGRDVPGGAPAVLGVAGAGFAGDADLEFARFVVVGAGRALVAEDAEADSGERVADPPRRGSGRGAEERTGLRGAVVAGEPDAQGRPEGVVQFVVDDAGAHHGESQGGSGERGPAGPCGEQPGDRGHQGQDRRAVFDVAQDGSERGRRVRP